MSSVAGLSFNLKKYNFLSFSCFVFILSPSKSHRFLQRILKSSELRDSCDCGYLSHPGPPRVVSLENISKSKMNLLCFTNFSILISSGNVCKCLHVYGYNHVYMYAMWRNKVDVWDQTQWLLHLNH